MSQAVSAFQRNKRLYMEQEQSLEQLICSKDFQTHFQSWLDSTLAALDSQYEACETRLGELQHTVAVDEGQYWSTKTLMQHCNLCISERRLLTKDAPLQEHPSWGSVIQLVSVLNNLKAKGFITPRQIKFLEKVESEFQNIVFEPHDLRCIAEALTTKLADEAESQAVVTDLTKFQAAIDEVAPDLDSSEQLLEAALLNGDMAVAEKVSYRQIDMHEHVLALICQQYPILERRHAETRDYTRRRRWAITRMTSRDIGGVIESKLRQIDACDEDLGRLKEQMDNYSADDGAQRKRYELDKGESDRYLDDNKEKQQSVWNRIHELFLELGQCQEELQKLAQLRHTEVDRRLRMEEREAGRRSGHHSFLRVASEHAKKLQDTIDNANAAKTLAKALNDFVLDGSDTVAAKFDRRQKALDEVLRVVQNNHFRRFSEYFLSAGRLVYRKERKMQSINDGVDDAHIKLELAHETLDLNAKAHANKKKELMEEKKTLAAEIVELRHRIGQAEDAIAPVLRFYDYNGMPYIHPRDILAKVNLDRADRIVEYREALKPALDKQEQILEEEERVLMDHRQRTVALEEEKRLRKLAVSPRPPQVTDSESSRYSRQYQRFQEILEKKLSMPEPVSASTQLAGAPQEGTTPGSAWSKKVGLTAEVITSHKKAKAPAPPQSPLKAEEVSGTALPAGSVTTPTKPPTAEPVSRGTPASSTGTKIRRKSRYDESDIVPGCTLKALFNYTASQPDELSFAAGDTVICLAPAGEEGWYSGISNQRSGLFPSNYVTVAHEEFTN